MKKLFGATIVLVACGIGAGEALARVSVAPYVSIKSTKTIKPGAKNSGTETSTNKQRQEEGLKASLSFFSILKAELSVGQNQLTTTQKTQTAVDDYGQIDYQKDLNMSTNDPSSEIKITETQRNGRFGLVLDPSIGFLILRAKAGVIATQRILTSQVTGQAQTTKVFGPYYKPTSGFGAGIRFTPTMYFMAEYNFYHYAFPKMQPFEREVAVSYAVEL